MTGRTLKRIVCALVVGSGLSFLAAGQGERPAEEFYKNIQLFKGMPASRLMPTMTRIAQWLGVDCAHCHVAGQYDKEDKPAKQTARKMFQMVRLVGRELNTDRVTCYTCHRGKPQPELPPESWKAKGEEMMKQADQDKRPAEQVFKNVQVLKGVPAGRWNLIMTMFTLSLGVDCTHCHVPGEFEKDDKAAKQMARKMLRLTGTIARESYQGNSPVNCYTCHKGEVKPVSMPPAAK
jgi:Photosynthetic reaction centre cytochrome C subunit